MSLTIQWIDQRIDDMLQAPSMWGSTEAVELQILLLLEMRKVVTNPDEALANPRGVLDEYAATLQRLYPNSPCRCLTDLVGRHHDGWQRVEMGREMSRAMKRVLVEMGIRK